jgi:hypothetical protein
MTEDGSGRVGNMGRDRTDDYDRGILQTNLPNPRIQWMNQDIMTYNVGHMTYFVGLETQEKKHA